jgi:hypothetical protein
MNITLTLIKYVVSDSYFWPSMAFTTMVGLFIGAIIYNGDISQVKKMIASLLSYMVLIVTVNLTRVIPQVTSDQIKPLASLVTIIFVTLFYLIGTYAGVLITKRANKKN